ncbi:MAG: winged helix-turn-helix domain-containing protein [Candidatus Micrarchaeota archaeon]|nr:winged helix-turn-helix domain-containing protein [Candidatus Micrarchaeota archaeon]
MDARSRLLFWLLSGTKGGPTRVRVLCVLREKPMNLRRLALQLGMDYKSVKAHIELLAKNGIIDAHGKYGAVYFISPEWEENEFMKQMLKGGAYGKGKGKK